MLCSGVDHGARGGARRSGSGTVPSGAPRGRHAGTRKAGAPRLSGSLGVQQASTTRAPTGPTTPATPGASVAIRAQEERATAAPDPRSPHSPSLRCIPGPARRGRGRRAGMKSHLHNGGWSQQRRSGAQAAKTGVSTARRATERPRAARGRRPRVKSRAREAAPPPYASVPAASFGVCAQLSSRPPVLEPGVSSRPLLVGLAHFPGLPTPFRWVLRLSDLALVACTLNERAFVKV